MGQVAVTFNGRTFRLRCRDGEEARVLELADYVSAKLSGLIAEFGQAGDERLLAMVALLITDELFEAREAKVDRAFADDDDDRRALDAFRQARGPAPV